MLFVSLFLCFFVWFGLDLFVSLVWFGLVRCVFVLFAWFALAWFRFVWFGLVWLCLLVCLFASFVYVCAHEVWGRAHVRVYPRVWHVRARARVHVRDVTFSMSTPLSTLSSQSGWLL